MKLHVFSIFDSKAENFNNPIFLPAVGQATRLFGDQVNDETSPFNKHPEDYTLFQIGTYDPMSGKLEPLTTPISLGLAIEYIENKQ